MQLLLINTRVSGGGNTVLPLWALEQEFMGLVVAAIVGSGVCLTIWLQVEQGCSGVGISPRTLLCTWLLLPALQDHCPGKGPSAFLSGPHGTSGFPRRFQAPFHARPPSPCPTESQPRSLIQFSGSVCWQAPIDPTVQTPNVLSCQWSVASLIFLNSYSKHSDFPPLLALTLRKQP